LLRIGNRQLSEVGQERITAFFQHRPETGIDDDCVAAAGLERTELRGLIAQLKNRDAVVPGIEAPVLQAQQHGVITLCQPALRGSVAFEILRFFN
jgi:hypothetical protein